MKTVEWGTKLEEHEIAERDAIWEQACARLESDILSYLDGKGYEFMNRKHDRLVCADCPEPSICSICKMDAAMNEHLKQPAITLTIYKER